MLDDLQSCSPYMHKQFSYLGSKWGRNKLVISRGTSCKIMQQKTTEQHKWKATRKYDSWLTAAIGSNYKLLSTLNHTEKIVKIVVYSLSSGKLFMIRSAVIIKKKIVKDRLKFDSTFDDVIVMSYALCMLSELAIFHKLWSMFLQYSPEYLWAICASFSSTTKNHRRR